MQRQVFSREMMLTHYPISALAYLMCAQKAAEFGRITQAITPFKVIESHQFRYQTKARMRLPILHPISLVSTFLQYIGQICAFDPGYLSL